jgi:hypothetical protein
MIIPSMFFSPAGDDTGGGTSEFEQDMTDLEGTNETAGDETDSEESDKDSTSAGEDRAGAEEDTESEEDEEGEEREDTDEDDELDKEEEEPEETLYMRVLLSKLSRRNILSCLRIFRSLRQPFSSILNMQKSSLM